MPIWTDPPADQLVNNEGRFSVAFIGENDDKERADILTRDSEFDARELALDMAEQGYEAHVFDPRGRRLS